MSITAGNVTTESVRFDVTTRSSSLSAFEVDTPDRAAFLRKLGRAPSPCVLAAALDGGVWLDTETVGFAPRFSSGR